MKTKRPLEPSFISILRAPNEVDTELACISQVQSSHRSCCIRLQDLVNRLRHRSIHSSSELVCTLAAEETIMSRYNSSYWDASDDSETDAADAADLMRQPESIDEHKRVDIYVPELLGKPKKLNQLKTELRKKFNVNSIEESKRTDIITVSGYGFDREDVLRAVRRYDSRAS